MHLNKMRIEMHKGQSWTLPSIEFQSRGAEFYRKILGAQIDPVGYVGINDKMSLVNPPDGIIAAEAADSPPDDINAYPS